MASNKHYKIMLKTAVCQPTSRSFILRAQMSRYARPIEPQEKPLDVETKTFPERKFDDPDNQLHAGNVRHIRKDHSTIAKFKYPYKLEDGGIQYYMFKYYPRHENEVDPPYQPTKVLLIFLRKHGFGRPWWEKKILQEMGFTYGCPKPNKVAVVKNVPEVLAKLNKVKHLIEIVPLKTPENFEKNMNKYSYWINEDGSVASITDCNLSEEKVRENPKLRLTTKFLDQKVRYEYQRAWSMEFN